MKGSDIMLRPSRVQASGSTLRSKLLLEPSHSRAGLRWPRHVRSHAALISGLASLGEANPGRHPPPGRRPDRGREWTVGSIFSL